MDSAACGIVRSNGGAMDNFADNPDHHGFKHSTRDRFAPEPEQEARTDD